MSDTPDFRCTTLGHGDDARAGIVDDAAASGTGWPSYWTFYVAVTDTDAAAATAVELGGSVEEPPTDSPYGRMARLSDPSGVPFRVLGPAPAA